MIFTKSSLLITDKFGIEKVLYAYRRFENESEREDVTDAAAAVLLHQAALEQSVNTGVITHTDITATEYNTWVRSLDPMNELLLSQEPFPEFNEGLVDENGNPILPEQPEEESPEA